MALTWQQAGAVTVALAGAAAVSSVGQVRGGRRVAPIAREATIVAGLYALWQLAGTLSVLGTSGALARARWIERVERWLPLPSEASVQHVVTANGGVAQAANLYYAAMHFTGMFAFLLWLFFGHRTQYRPVRRVLATTTFACLAVQLVPVAPPRLLPGFTDTAVRYGQSLYHSAFGADELSAMPSVHVAWAVLIAVTTWRLGRGTWRWIGPAHAVLTVVVVVATANHWWADCIAAIAVLALCSALVRWAEVHAAALPGRPPARRVEREPQSAHPALIETS